ncbi:MAG: hypothetical protein VXX04_00435, partial [Actinomycetota bacterium]|nr:hypothetical protein [Actinomycetota bacterium]
PRYEMSATAHFAIVKEGENGEWDLSVDEHYPYDDDDKAKYTRALAVALETRLDVGAHMDGFELGELVTCP